MTGQIVEYIAEQNNAAGLYERWMSMESMENNLGMIEVQSSNIKSVGYLGGDLYVKYPSGVYVYRGVPKALFEGLLKADSKGRYLNENIKGVYGYMKLVDADKR